jgi:rare lipoprotein A
MSGCGSRHTMANRPEPAQPETTETSNNAEQPGGIERGSGAATKTPMTNAPSTSAKRDIPASNPAMRAYTEQGNASWYGIPFDGRRASNGEIYNMHKLTAAHRTLPFDTVVRVTNLSNGKSTVVRITDRGPFVDNRIIDLSMAAAREIDSIGPGVVPVRLEILSPGIDPTSGFFTVQVGAFRDRGNAERLRERLNAEYSPIFIQPYDSPDGLYYRVRVGKVPGEDAAQHFGEQLRNREGIKPIVVRLDDGGGSRRNQ